MAKITDILPGLNETLGVASDKLIAELEALAARLGVDLSGPLPQNFLTQARALYSAYLSPVTVMETLRTVGLAEILVLLKTGRVAKRKRRVGANTA